MVPAILYVVVYMRHTSNLEKAIEFASRNLQYPLSLDFKKYFIMLKLESFQLLKRAWIIILKLGGIIPLSL